MEAPSRQKNPIVQPSGLNEHENGSTSSRFFGASCVKKKIYCWQDDHENSQLKVTRMGRKKQ
jgi:hypothetical protein